MKTKGHAINAKMDEKVEKNRILKYVLVSYFLFIIQFPTSVIY